MLSQARLIYPLLDGFLLGDLLSEHDGVRCYPAIRQKNGEKYIVKVISVPASSVQLDALLLAGAFPSKTAALRYFKDLAKDILAQAQILSQLSQQEGFAAYHGSQMISSADGDGFEVYLLGSLKTSLEKHLETGTMTQRGVVEMGLDLCAALAACRRAGYLYVDLQPGNVFRTDENGYLIGDVGFVPLDSLQFASLQKQYRSRYTAPEMSDDFAQLNTTVDIYALGLILYQACNGGFLPKNGDFSAAPMYADYELAEIISKACSPTPKDRWQDPSQMAQALISYMQRNGVSDENLIPVIPPADDDPTAEDFLPAVTAEELSQEIAALPESEVILMEAMAAEQDDLSHIIAQADALIDHEAPNAAMVPSRNDGDSQQPEPFHAQELEATPQDIPEAAEEFQTGTVPSDYADEIYCPVERRPFPWRILLTGVCIILLLVGAVFAKRYYDHVYIQNVEDLLITQADGAATVKVISDIDESLLTVLCADSYGNVKRSPVTAGIAMFTGLDPQTHYTIRIQISGHHKLTGQTTDSFTTEAQTTILGFVAYIGPEDGSVLLSFTTSGPEVDVWTVTYEADGIAPRSASFSGNSVTIYDLEVGKDYTFTLSANGQQLGGSTAVSYTASNIILAQDLAIIACGGGSLTAQWAAPDGFTPKNGWAVRCYNGAGYDQTVITYEPHYTFTGLDHSVPCHVDVTYVSMTQYAGTSVCANPITVEKFDYTVSNENGLTIRWTYSGTAPEGGWDVLCVIDGKTIQVRTEEPFIVAKVFPGSKYQISLSAADGTSIFGGDSSYTISEVAPFIGYGVNAEMLSAQISGHTITLTAPAETTVESSEHLVDAMCLIRNADGVLCAAFEDEFLWNTIWEGNVCTMLLPALPDTPGAYVLSIYFDGGWVAEVEFTVE